MPSRLTTIAQIALITLLVALVGISSWYSSHGPPNTVSLPGRSNTFFQWLTHDAAGFFALWLVIIGGIQLAMFWRQLRLIRESLVDAKQAADAATQGAKAAETNAQALIDAESAQVYVVILESNIPEIFQRARFYDNTPSMASGKSEEPLVEYRLRNYGKSPAIIRQVVHGFSLANPKQPKEREYGNWNRAMEIVGVGEQSLPIKCEYDGSFSFGDARSMATNDALLFFYGLAIFLDTFGREHHLEWEFFADNGRWELIAHRETRKEPSSVSVQ